MNKRETVAYWLDYAPKMWEPRIFSILIDQLEHGLPLDITVAERNARLEALYMLTKKDNHPKRK